MEKWEVEQVRGWHDGVLGSEGGHGWRRVEGDLCEGRVGLKPGIVAIIAQVVKSFVRVLDCDFGDGVVSEKGARYSVEEVPAVRVVLVGGKDEEL